MSARIRVGRNLTQTSLFFLCLLSETSPHRSPPTQWFLPLILKQPNLPEQSVVSMWRCEDQQMQWTLINLWVSHTQALAVLRHRMTSAHLQNIQISTSQSEEQLVYQLWQQLLSFLSRLLTLSDPPPLSLSSLFSVTIQPVPPLNLHSYEIT